MSLKAIIVCITGEKTPNFWLCCLLVIKVAAGRNLLRWAFQKFRYQNSLINVVVEVQCLAFEIRNLCVYKGMSGEFRSGGGCRCVFQAVILLMNIASLFHG